MDALIVLSLSTHYSYDYQQLRLRLLCSRRSMRGSEVRLLSAYGHSLRLKPRSSIASLRPSIWLVQHRTASAVSTVHHPKLLDRTTPNPATSHYEDASKYPAIRLKDFSPKEPISSRDLVSTRPAKLESPEPLKQEDFNGDIPVSDRLKWFYRLGRSYLAFYKTGFKNIWYNYKELKKIRGTLEGRTLEDVVKYGLLKEGDGNGEQVPILSRRDYQVALRTRHDLGKLIPFSIVFAICGEFTPLFILAIGSAAVPYTCRIPKQEQGDFLRPVKTWPKYANQVGKLVAEEAKGGPNRQWKSEFLEAYRLHANPLPYPVPVLGQLWHTLYSRARLRKHCEEVLCDTILIQREGGFQKLTPRELFEWTFKYGLPTLTAHMDSLHRKGAAINPDSPELKEILLASVEAEVQNILDVDWKRVKPENHWLAVYRPIWSERTATSEDEQLSGR